MAAAEGDDNAKKDDIKIEFRSPSGIGPKTFNFYCSKIYDDSKVEKDHEDEGNDGGGEYPEVHNVVLHVGRISSQRRHMISWNPLCQLEIKV